MMRNADLDDRPPRGSELDEKFRREERAAGLDRDVLEGRPPEELAGAVDVPNPEAEPDEVREPVDPRVERS